MVIDWRRRIGRGGEPEGIVSNAGILGMVLLLVGSAEAGKDDCYPSTIGRFPSVSSDSLIWREALDAAGIDTNVCGVALGKWPYRRDAYVLYAETPMEYGVMEHQMVLLLKAKDSFEVFARHRSEGDPYVFESFDFAPYSIRGGSKAIGLRLQTMGPTIGGQYRCTKLVLFSPQEGELRPIFSANAYFSGEGNDVAYDESTRYEEEGSAIFIIEKPDRSGYNRIVRKSDRGRMVYAWDGIAYALDVGKSKDLSDPTEHSFCDDEYR